MTDFFYEAKKIASERVAKRSSARISSGWFTCNLKIFKHLIWLLNSIKYHVSAAKTSQNNSQHQRGKHMNICDTDFFNDILWECIVTSTNWAYYINSELKYNTCRMMCTAYANKIGTWIQKKKKQEWRNKWGLLDNGEYSKLPSTTDNDNDT